MEKQASAAGSPRFLQAGPALDAQLFADCRGKQAPACLSRAAPEASVLSLICRSLGDTTSSHLLSASDVPRRQPHSLRPSARPGPALCPQACFLHATPGLACPRPRPVETKGPVGWGWGEAQMLRLEAVSTHNFCKDLVPPEKVHGRGNPDPTP